MTTAQMTTAQMKVEYLDLYGKYLAGTIKFDHAKIHRMYCLARLLKI